MGQVKRGVGRCCVVEGKPSLSRSFLILSFRFCLLAVSVFWGACENAVRHSPVLGM